MSTDAALWAAVLALGAFHGLNPAMGWPLAVANGLTERRGSAVLATLAPLAAGHLLAMLVVLLPFTALAAWLTWERPLRLAAGLGVAAYGAWRLVNRRHPRFLARVRPTQLVLWSFLMASAHGAGLMLLPVAMGLCAAAPEAAATLATDLGSAAGVAAVHTLALLASGAAAAWAVYRYFGLRALNRAWLNVDAAWALGLLVAGLGSVAAAAR